MEKIKIKLDFEQLKVLNDSWDCIQNAEVINTEQKIIFDIAVRLSVKFKKKAIDREFNSGKFNISIHFFEAYFLSKILQIYLNSNSFSNNPYEYNVILKIDNFLQMKLA